jgi:hypothetical protein
LEIYHSILINYLVMPFLLVFHLFNFDFFYLPYILLLRLLIRDSFIAPDSGMYPGMSLYILDLYVLEK